MPYKKKAGKKKAAKKKAYNKKRRYAKKAGKLTKRVDIKSLMPRVYKTSCEVAAIGYFDVAARAQNNYKFTINANYPNEPFSPVYANQGAVPPVRGSDTDIFTCVGDNDTGSSSLDAVEIRPSGWTQLFGQNTGFYTRGRVTGCKVTVNVLTVDEDDAIIMAIAPVAVGVNNAASEFYQGITRICQAPLSKGPVTVSRYNARRSLSAYYTTKQVYGLGANQPLDSNYEFSVDLSTGTISPPGRRWYIECMIGKIVPGSFDSNPGVQVTVKYYFELFDMHEQRLSIAGPP